MGLIVLYPQYSTVDLVCGTLPSKDDDSVILFAEAAYTGELLKEFKHTNVAGDHVSKGERHKGISDAIYLATIMQKHLCHALPDKYKKDLMENIGV